ncbi:trypsin-like serine peptidase [Paeniroseomonas aquatica]|uniref:trypsin-like serine peptidase n=1 Tax=Paeniroseomonas aquatica TaxID=373043 RepID=UPI00361A6715
MSSSMANEAVVNGGSETVPEYGAENEATEANGEAASSLRASHAVVSYSIPSETTQQAGGDEGGDGGEAVTDEGFGFNLGPFSVSFEAAEESGAEAQFESVEGWDESAQEAAEEADAEAVVDAWYGEASESQQQEFFQFLAPLMPILLKTVVPAVASAAAKNLPGAVSGILQRLGRRRVSGPRREAGGLEAGLDEAALEAASQQLEMIIDRDDRTQVLNTTAVPWKRICHLEIIAANGRKFLGSGALVAPRTVITAGHCVFMRQQGLGPLHHGLAGPQRRQQAARLLQGGGAALGAWLGQRRAARLRLCRDHPAHELPHPPCQRLRLRQPAGPGTAQPQAEHRRLSRRQAGRHAVVRRPQGHLADPRTIVYNTATMGGQSGSPVWLRRADGARLMVGIHTNGSMSGNSATRITAPVLANLKRWRQEGMTSLQGSATAGTAGQRTPGFRTTLASG